MFDSEWAMDYSLRIFEIILSQLSSEQQWPETNYDNEKIILKLFKQLELIFDAV